MDDFYADTLRRLLNDGWLGLNSSVLVVCGGRYDRDTFYALGFRRVTISNLDVRMVGDEYAPYAWSMQDVESLGFGDGEFDFVVVHQGLHHCYSPHRGLLEMYRVAKAGVVVFEPRDTRLVRLGVRIGFGQEYEIAAVAGNGLHFGGVGNSSTPNYVYRWTKQEVEKTILTGFPSERARFRYYSALRFPESRLQIMKNRGMVRLLRMLLPAARVFAKVFPGQTNCFAFAISKTGELHPWMRSKECVDAEWMGRRYLLGKHNGKSEGPGSSRQQT
jgi:SAM-dependent methyltransferase